MIKGLSLSLLLVGATLGAQQIPDRPEKLTYPTLAFQAPRTKDFLGKLKNGIPVYVAPDPSGVPFVRINVLIKGGSYLEPQDKAGLASLLGSQWRAGGTTTTPADKLDEELEFLAASISTSLGDTSGSISMQVMKKDLDKGMDLFMQVLLHPAFAQDRLDLAKKAAKQAMDTRNDNVMGIAGYQMGYLLHGEKHFTNLAMTEASLAAIQPADMKALHERLVHPANMVIAVSGQFDRKAILDTLNRSLGSFKPAPTAQVSPKVPAPEHTRKPGLYLVDKDVPQSVVRLVLPGLRRTDADWHAVQVMNQVLGGSGFTSRLMKKLRSDEGLTYGVSTGFNPGAYWKGDFSCGLQTKNRSVAYAIRLILAEIEKMKAAPVTDEEMKVIKDGIVLAYPGDWGKKDAVASRFASEHMAGWPADWWVDYREKIQAVTKEDVLRVAKKYLDPSQFVILVVGKLSEAKAGDEKDHPGLLKDVAPLPMVELPLRDPKTMKPLK